MTRRLSIWLTAAVVVALGVAPTAAQETTGVILGTTTSLDAVALPGVMLTLTNPDTGFQRTVISGSDGGYKLVALPPARYEP